MGLAAWPGRQRPEESTDLHQSTGLFERCLGCGVSDVHVPALRAGRVRSVAMATVGAGGTRHLTM